MYALLDSHYQAVSRGRFEDDLAEKDIVILIRDRGGVIQGFSTVKRGRLAIPTVRYLYSGDTIIDRRHWGSQTLARAWLRLAGSEKARELATPLYWLLISKGPRTYRYLSAFARRYWPHPEAPMPRDMQCLRDRMAADRFGSHYDPASGIVCWPDSRGHLRPELAEIAPADWLRPDIACFLQANPGYARGDELVCLSEIARDNLKPFAQRIFDAGYRDHAAGLAIAS